MRDWLAEQAAARPTGLALTFEGQRWIYAALNQAVDDLCRRLAALQIPQGSLVAVHLTNSPEYACLVHALARLGLVLAPLNTRLAAPELAWQLDHLNCEWLIGESTPSISLSPASVGATHESPLQSLTLAELYAIPPVDFQPAPFTLDRLQAVIFTSGTSGRPKAAMLSFANHFYSAWASAARLGVLPDDRWLSVLPLYHVGGLAVLFRSALYGTSAALHRTFDLQTVQHALADAAEPVTMISLVPTMLHRLLPDLSASPPGQGQAPPLRLILLGGAAASEALLAECVQRGLPVAATYGLTEAATQVATQSPADFARKPGSAGRPLLFTRLRISDEQGGDLPAGQIGEICVQGPTVMQGYYHNAAASERALRDGWLHTGDLGYLDDDGDLWVVQRRSDLIVSGGENVYPAEVEQALYQHPAVADACVVGLPDAEWGQRVAAAVVLRPDNSASVDELITFLRGRLAGYKLPRRMRILDALPQTASGKIARQEVAEWLAEK